MASKDKIKAVAQEIEPQHIFFSSVDKRNEEIQEQKKEQEESKKKPNRKKKEYIRLDINECKDYVYVMSHRKGVSMTKFIQDLIVEDMKKNEEVFQKAKKALKKAQEE